MKITRKFTTEGQCPFDSVKWVTRSSRISNPDGSIVFEMDDAEVPESWSQLATDIMVSKYFRKAGVPEDGGENGLPVPGFGDAETPGRTGFQPVSSSGSSGFETEKKGERKTDKMSVPQGQEGESGGEMGWKPSPSGEKDGGETGWKPSPSGEKDWGETGWKPVLPREVREAREAGEEGQREGKVRTGPEKSAKQVIHRLAGCWKHWGESHGYFDSHKDAQAFYDEIVYMMTHQMCAPNSPQWFNTGLNWAYGVNGPAQGHWVADHKTGQLKLAEDAYTHPQPHACFIQSISDDLVNPGGIMDLWTREARLFKYGSGTGTNFSNLRAEGECLSGGGKSSGLMSWLKIGDRAAGAIKSGGTTRRAAKMVCLDMDHPDIEAFINWKVREEIKVAAMVEGMKIIAGQRAGAGDAETIGETAERLGLRLDYDFNGEAYSTVSGQNSNNSVRIPDSFFDALDEGDAWETTRRTDGKVANIFDAGVLWDDIAYAAWRCADPGVQFDSTINAWHTCPSGGRINASNPCSEYMFLDNTACNLASLNVLKFYDAQSRSFDVEAFEHAVDLWTTVLEISVLMASFPSADIARLSWKYRTLGLGYANLGAMLMQAGVPYDSEEGRAICGCLSAILTGRSYRKSAELAREHGPFAGFADDRENMLRVIRNHRLAAHGEPRGSAEYEGLRIRPVPIDHGLIESGRVPLANAKEMLAHATRAWDEALSLGFEHGYRNAQTTVIAPTGTIGLLMDCDTTGVEPDFALVKFKKLSGGGYFKIANNSVRPALRALGYEPGQIDEIMIYLLGTLDLDVPMPAGDNGDELGIQEGMTFAQWLRSRGANEEDLDKIKGQLQSVFELKSAFSAWGLGDETLGRLGIDAAKAKADKHFNGLRAMGLSAAQAEELNRLICGTQTIEGAPHLRDEHLPVFDCASVCGKVGTRLIAAEGHIRMMAAAQPFITGAISKTINLPNSATVEDIQSCYRLSWELGLKANAIYRDGCKLSQPLNATADAELEAEDPDELGEALEEVADEVMAVAAAASAGDAAGTSEIKERIVHRPMRRRLSDTRSSVTHKFNVAGHEGYLTVGLYEDGLPGELFITMAKEGSTIGGLMDSLGTATSVALQYGVPLNSLVRKFTHQRFEPAGMTTNRDIPFAKSLVDYIFRWLGIEFLPGYREANAPRRPESMPVERSVESDEGGGGGGDRPRMDTSEPPSGRFTGGGVEWTAPGRGNTDAKSQEAGFAGSAGTSMAPAVDASSALSDALEAAGDAPPCDVCGTITVRSGTCYKCLNCGNSMGCS